MSFNLPPLKAKASVPDTFEISSGHYGIPNPLVDGLATNNIGSSHPLEAAERNFHQNQLQREMTILRNVQGLHAPLRLAMELKSTENIGRLPFLPSSSVMRDILLGRDEEIGFEDVLNTPEFREQMLQPHATVEKKLGFL
ncbi:proteasome maturation protein [Chelonus insularis]|uniref:proteasome maturation protein n=1 Tax=Chelonus insularis TaxID=460826 RepID=UPI001588FAA5|nr:proteasome maturation protein [Chelonus insularis]